MTLEEGLDKPVVIVGIEEVEAQGTTMVAVRDYVPVVFTSVVVRIVVKLTVVADVDTAVAVLTPNVDTAVVAVHSLVVVVIVAVPVTES